jgi:hypothetical protein
MDSLRLSRFKRAATPAPMQVTERDRRIIRFVQRHRFLRSSHIVALIGGSSQQILRRLQLLYHHGYLERPRAQIDYYQRGGSNYMVYGIGNKGAALLKAEFSIPFDQLNWNAKNRSVGRIFIEHALLVSDIMVKIEIACRENGQIQLLSGDEVALASTISRRRQQFKWKVTIANGAKVGIVPDRVFALEYPDAGANRARTFFFLEADRGTMPVNRRNLSQSSFFRKLLAYESTWSLSIHRARFGFHRFRVLTVTTTGERTRSFVRACSQLKTGHGLFLFTDRTFLDKPMDIFSLKWQTARPGRTATLLN